MPSPESALSKDELIHSLKHEVNLVLHLASKIEAPDLDYRPSPKQRSLLELLQYLTIMAPIHLRAITVEAFDLEAWKKAWGSELANAESLNVDEAKEAIAKHPALFASLIGSLSESDLRAPFEMFGNKSTRGALIVSLVLCHYSAYRMQLFLYLKSCCHEELSTMNLWAGRDAR